MSWTRRRFELIVTWVPVVVWAVVYVVALAVALANGDPVPPETALRTLVLPPLLWVVAARLVLHHWWPRTGSRMAAMDPPARLLAAAVATLPDRRRQWGMAMTAELAEVRGRSARWRFALSSARATLWQRPAGGWPVLVLVAGAVAASVAAAGPAVAAAVPGLGVFAVSFTGLVGAMVVLAVARSRRPRLPVPAPTLVVAGGVAAAITMTVVFLRREPAAAGYLPPAAAVFLAAVLAGCLWVAVAAPRWLGSDRLAPHLGAAAAVVFAGWFLLAIRGTESLDRLELPFLLEFALVPVLTLVLVVAPVAILFLPAVAAGVVGRSFRSGVQAAVWTVIATAPLTYALWLPEGLRRHAADGALLDGELGPVGATLGDAMFFCLGLLPALGLPFAVIGAGLAAFITRPPAVAQAPPDGPTTSR
jgi:uncharacterized membrane protein YeaQ/YmgE (transglycosylase-associated protein family)